MIVSHELKTKKKFFFLKMKVKKEIGGRVERERERGEGIQLPYASLINY